ncbi:uncharacterized protein KY384_005880 [Bacidia gigantensis]|uniref:uncharacterized protein n=1 Tax=Bacidia gigantensis TaxID=2732470 RepID=UPI001D03BAEB|nr:uncharacterized protein KY384_005880 [Bacidia gigantensis]KAG8529245.1 hypothetical protein KY384_005880 [Bacidia gigantensis]
MIIKARVLGEQIRKEHGVETAIQAIYRDLEYAKSLIKHRKAIAKEGEGWDLGEESWTFIGDESDPELRRRIQEWDAPWASDGAHMHSRKSFQRGRKQNHFAAANLREDASCIVKGVPSIGRFQARMSGASDKARFYLEQSVPELQELERKKIFTKPEITSIARKRSDYEHKLSARGSHRSDYIRYIEYEMNLESLRKKRVKRLGVKSTNHIGQRRLFGLLDRATKKFHGDVGLWMQYLSFARRQGSHKKIGEVLTRMLRLHPTKAELWVWAAKYAVEEKGDVGEARSFLQRGLRFCGRDRELWVEYGKLECIFIAKIVGRRQLLGLEGKEAVSMREVESDGHADVDVISLPTITAGDYGATLEPGQTRQHAMERLDTSAALSGAAPMAIFDAAAKQLGQDGRFGLDFFDMIAEFDQLPCQQTILNHVLDTMRAVKPQTANITIRFVRQSIIGVDSGSPQFPAALTTSLSRIQPAITSLPNADVRVDFRRELISWLLSFLVLEDLDEGLKQVAELSLKKAWSQQKIDVGDHNNVELTNMVALLDTSKGELFRQLVESERL